MTAMKNIKMIIFFVLTIQSWVQAYNAEHRPFPDDGKPTTIPLIDHAEPTVLATTNELEWKAVAELPGGPSIRIKITRDDDYVFAEMQVGDHTVVPRTPFGLAGCSPVFTVQSGDLNGDRKRDVILRSWAGGCGLASGYNYQGIFLSSGDGYSLTPLTALWPDAEDFFRMGEHYCILHTEFFMEEDCTDGNQHGFWVYNILEIDGDHIRIANNLLPGFPKAVWYSDAPNHKDDTKLLTAQQKQRLIQLAQDRVFWKPNR